MIKRVSHVVRAANDNLLLDNQLCFPLYAASRLVTRLYHPLLEPLGLTYPQYVVLMILWEDAPCSVSHIGDRSLLNSNTLTPLLKRIEELGYIRRTRSTSDERVVEVSLTDLGQCQRANCGRIPGDIAEHWDFSAEKSKKLKKLLAELIGLLKAHSVP
jgi:MarR family transcriptional regulator, organic hydroperoxide resistance regulator